MVELNLTFFVQIANFLIFMVLFNRILLRPLLRILDERKHTIEHSHAEAERLTEETMQTNAKVDAALSMARKDLAQERHKAYMVAARKAQEIDEKVEAETRASVEEGGQKLTKEADSAWLVVQKQTGLLAKKILERLRAA